MTVSAMAAGGAVFLAGIIFGTTFNVVIKKKVRGSKS